MRNAILTISSAAKTATSGKFGAVLKSTLFAVLLAAASMAGAVPIPGTPVPITLQTFVVMLAALMLPWKQGGRRGAHVSGRGRGWSAGVRRRRVHHGFGRPERRLPHRFPAGRRRHLAAQGQGACRFPEACCVDRRTVPVRLRGRLRRA